jgi:CubicO group peptidase (beta-lactamase class C family)
VRDQILQPLGMTSSGFEPTEPMRPLLSRGYEVAKDGTVEWTSANEEWNGRGYRIPNGGLISTMRDLSKFVAWELGAGPEDVLKREAQADNYSRVMIAAADMAGGYGLGFQVQRRGTLVAYGHGGTTSGFLSQAVFDRDSRTGVIVFRNVTGGKLNPNGVALRALEIVSVARKKQTD